MASPEPWSALEEAPRCLATGDGHRHGWHQPPDGARRVRAAPATRV